jgi:DNA-binding response OmpR family regulator
VKDNIVQNKSKILAVDDNSINLAVIEELLQDQYHLVTVSTGTEALKVAQQFRPDLILLDIMLHGMNGYEVCRKVRKTSSLKHTKIIMVTAKAMESEQLEGYQVGADDYLTKPFDGDELLEKVSFHLNQRSIEAASTDM